MGFHRDTRISGGKKIGGLIQSVDLDALNFARCPFSLNEKKLCFFLGGCGIEECGRRRWGGSRHVLMGGVREEQVPEGRRKKKNFFGRIGKNGDTFNSLGEKKNLRGSGRPGVGVCVMGDGREGSRNMDSKRGWEAQKKSSENWKVFQFVASLDCLSMPFLSSPPSPTLDEKS